MVKRARSHYKPRRWLTAVDLYCGSGAVTQALKVRHFRVAVGIDNDPVACETFRANHPATRLIEDDISNVDVQEIRRRDLGRRNLDLLIVCAPCQPFSSQNRSRKLDKRAKLILQAARFAEVLKPTLILFENVPGLASPKGSRILRQLKKKLGAEYVLSKPHQVDAADYGVPQRRVRCIMFAVRRAPLPLPPKATTAAGRGATVRQAIGKLTRLRSGQSDANDSLHSARNHSEIALRRLKAVPKNGGSRSSLPKHLRLDCHKRLGRRKFSDVYGRMKWDDVAPTLTTGCTDITRGRFGHPRDDRAITLREAALLQTFPPTYQFLGSVSAIAMQIGNAVPVKLIDAFAPSLRAAIRVRV